MKLIKIIEINKNKTKEIFTLDFITQINIYFISGGPSQHLYIINENYKIIKKDNHFKDWVYNISLYLELNEKDKESTKIIGGSKKYLIGFNVHDDKLFVKNESKKIEIFFSNLQKRIFML